MTADVTKGSIPPRRFPFPLALSPGIPPDAVAVCKGCGEGIGIGDRCYEYDGELYHEECFEDAALSILIGEGATLREADASDADDGSDEEYERRRERWMFS